MIVVARRSCSADPLDESPMPSLIRLLLLFGLLGGLAYGAVVTLAMFVEPKPREITITIPAERLQKSR